MNNHSIAFQFWLELKRKHKIYGTLNHEMIIADIEELLNQQAAQPRVQPTVLPRGVKCLCLPTGKPYDKCPVHGSHSR